MHARPFTTSSVDNSIAEHTKANKQIRKSLFIYIRVAFPGLDNGIFLCVTLKPFLSELIYTLIMLLFLLIAGSVQGDIQVGLITSPFTSKTLIDALASDLPGVLKRVENDLALPSKIQIIWEQVDLLSETDEFAWRLPPIFLDKSILVVLDAANSVRYSSFLSDQAIFQNFLHVVMSRPMDTFQDESASPNTLFAETTFISQAECIYDLIHQYSWINIGLIQDEGLNNSQMSSTLQGLLTDPVQVLDQLVLDSSDIIDETELNYRMQSTTKYSNARVIVVMTESNIAAMALKAGDKSVMGGAGYTWILNSDAMVNIGKVLKNSNAGLPSETFGVVKTGAIGVLAEDTLYEEFEPMASYIAMLTLIGQAFVEISDPTGTALFEYIVSNPATPSLEYSLHFTSAGVKISKYFIYNIVNFAAFKVGYWDSLLHKIVLDQGIDITWPGFTKEIPNDTVPILQLALLYPAHDNSGNVNSIGVDVKRGFDLAISEINSDQSVLNGYIIQCFYIDTFDLPILASSNLKVLDSFNILGFVGPSDTDLTKAYLAIEATKSDSKPLITYSASSTSLSNSITYENLLQIIQPNGLQAVALALYLQLQGWHEVGVIYTDDDLGQEGYTSLLANVGTLEITIKNPELSRAIRYSENTNGLLSDDTKNSIGEVLDEIVVQQIKVIVFLGNIKAGPEVAKQGAKKELHGSEYAWLGCIWLTEETLSDIDTNYLDDKDTIFQVLEGAIGLDYRGPQGTPGEKFSQDYLETYSANYSTTAMLAYDAVYTYANVIDGMITRGDDYNSGTELINSLRSADLNGASGKIKFSEGSNGRSAYGYNIVNIQSREIIQVEEYDPLSPNLFTSLNNASVIWGGQQSSPPVDVWPNAYDCPFAEHMSKISYSGVGIIIAIGSSLFIITLVLSYFSYQKWKQLTIEKITTGVYRSWKDTLVQAQIAIEFFQFIAIAPTFSSLQIVISAASNIFMLDVMKVAQTSKSDYWILLAVVCGLCYIWFSLVLFIMINGEHLLERLPFCRRIVSIMNSVFLSFFGNTMFLPALALLLDMFVCDHQAQGHAYVWRDCYTKCWEGKHSNFIAMSIIAIVCYEPIAAYSRPLWQQSRTGLNLKIDPKFLLLKTCMQILLIAIGKSLQSISPVAHGVVFTILISSFAVAIYKLRPFNYNRCNLWEFTTILSVAYMSFLATLSYVKDPTHIGWFIALMLGWFIIIGGSLLIQRKYMPNLLLAPGKNKNKKRVYAVIGVKSDSIDLDDSSIAKAEEFRNDESSIQVNRIEANNNADVEDDEAQSISV